MTAVAQPRERAFSERGPIARSYRRFLGKSMLLMFALILIGAYLLPLLYMVTTAFQQPGQSTVPGAPVWPAEPQTATWNGEAYPLYSVPMPDGTTRSLILVDPGRETSTFVDPTDPARWGTLLRPSPWFWDPLYLWSNYHLEHHYFPKVPFYRLRALRRALEPFFRERGVPARTYGGLLWRWFVRNRTPHTNWDLVS